MDWIWYGLNKELFPIWKNPVVKPVLVTIATEVMTKTIWKRVLEKSSCSYKLLSAKSDHYFRINFSSSKITK